MKNTLKSLIKNLIVVFAVLGVASCNSENGKDNETENNARLIPVETIILEEDSFSDQIRLTGTVEAIEDATISSETSGRIQYIRNRGERVRKGDIIARVDSRMIEAQLSSAQAAFELADDTFNRLEALYADSIVSTQDYRNARAQRQQARAQLDQAEKQLQDSRIQAPFDGRIEDRMIRIGELINPGMPVARLVNTDMVRVLSGIPERYSGDITEGAEVVVHFRAFGNLTRNSTITYASNVIDPDTRSFTIEVELTNENEAIKPEMVADLRITRRTLDNSIIIPRTAVIRDETGEFVFVSKDENGRKTADLVQVRLGSPSGSLVQVIDGLSSGDEVVVTGTRSLSIGDELNVISSESSIERTTRLKENSLPVASY